MTVLVDASTLIALARAGRLGTLRAVVRRCAITPQVRDELRAREDETTHALEGALEVWIDLVSPREVPARFARVGLGVGEASLIASAKPGDVLVLDDRQARALAQSLGLRFVGLVGLLLEGVETGRLSPADARDTLDGVERAGFWISPDVKRLFHLRLDRRAG